MKNSTNLQENLQDFIEERMQESYSIVTNKKNYQEQFNKYKLLEKEFINKLKDENMIENYHDFRNIRMDLNAQELQEAYLLGFRDSTIIYNHI